MSTTSLRGRFVITKGNKVRPIVIVSESNMLCGCGKDQHNCRGFFSPLEGCVKSEFVSPETAKKCITDQYDRLKNSKGQISDSYPNTPKTLNGYMKGFFTRSISDEKFTQHKNNPYFFEKYTYKSLKPFKS